MAQATGTRAETDAADGLPTPRRYWAVASIWLAITMAVLDGAIANVALPTIARDLNASAASAIWVVNAYQLAITVCLLPLASLGDIFGYRRVYIAGLVVFTAASAACAFADSLPALTAARIVQGLGGAAIMSINGALVRFTFPQRLLGRGVGLNALVVSVSAAVGPTVAAAILAHGTWPMLFAINIPIGIVALAVAARSLPRTPRAERRFDTVSAILNALTFGFLIYGAERTAREGLLMGGWMLAVGAVAGLLLVRRELARPAPLLPLDLLRIPIFRLSVGTSIVSFAAQMLAFVALPFYFQTMLGRSVVETGLLMTPWPLSVAFAAPLAGRLSDRYAAGLLGAIGLMVFSAGLASLAMLQPGAETWDIVWRMALCGLGFGFFQSPNNRTMLSAAPKSRSGAAGGMLATARLLGQTSGAATMAILFHTLENQAMRTGLVAAAVLALVGAGLSSLRRNMRVESPVEAEVG